MNYFHTEYFIILILINIKHFLIMDTGIGIINRSEMKVLLFEVLKEHDEEKQKQIVHYYSKHRVAKLLKRADKTVDRWIKEGKIKVDKGGRISSLEMNDPAAEQRGITGIFSIRPKGRGTNPIEIRSFYEKHLIPNTPEILEEEGKVCPGWINLQ